uniref:BTB domain-containing protein n=1 Tax=Oryza meridionalis TaxID=40149 RepID=A0A0E0CEL1_9ORYZ
MTLACNKMHNYTELKTRCLDFFMEESNFKKGVVIDGYFHLSLLKLLALASWSWEKKTLRRRPRCSRSALQGQASCSSPCNKHTPPPAGNMLASGFIEYKLDYLESQKLAIGKCLPHTRISAGELNAEIQLYPRGLIKPDNGEYISLFLVMKNDPKISVIFEAFLMGKDGAPPSSTRHADRSTQIITIHLSNKTEEDDRSWRFIGWYRFAKRSDVDSLHAIDGVVTFVFGLVILRDDRHHPIAVPPPNLGGHLAAMVGSADGSDVSFSVGGETLIRAHHAVLAARSPVFRAELLGDMAEATMPCKLWESVTVETVAETLACAEMHSCPELKSRCLDFFVEENNFKKVGFPSLIDEIKARLEI